ncbi:MAG: hypothetical protein IKZ50_01305 [Bacteroidales bacterium]|nr:hypothetical protein [Bacteroidales bacterium]MBR5907013.1 hypothetical protein [Bacteroidales bacterium]
MRRLLLLALLSFFSAIVILESAFAADPEDAKGQQLFQQASDYIFSARKISFVMTTTVKGKEYQSRGFIVALPERGYLKIEGVSEFQYTPSLISYYDQKNNEIVIQPRRSTSASLSENPFSILSRSAKGVNVTAPVEKKVGGKTCSVITVMPKGKAYYKTADVYVVRSAAGSAVKSAGGAVGSSAVKFAGSAAGSAESVKVERIDVTLKNGDSYTIAITSASEPDAAKVSDYQLLPSNYPDAQITDLR